MSKLFSAMSMYNTKHLWKENEKKNVIKKIRKKVKNNPEKLTSSYLNKMV